MKSIGSAISNFGNDLQANIEATQITTEDFKIKTTGKGNSSGFKKTNDGNSNGMQKSGGNGSGSTAYKTKPSTTN